MGNDIEIIINFWIVINTDGLLVSLKARHYVSNGNDTEKLDFMRERAKLDFMIAEDFPLPQWLNTTIGNEKFNSAFYRDVKLIGNEIDLFNEVFIKLESQVSQTGLLIISDKPLVIITPLLLDDKKQLSLFPNMETKEV